LAWLSGGHATGGAISHMWNGWVKELLLHLLLLLELLSSHAHGHPGVGVSDMFEGRGVPDAKRVSPHFTTSAKAGLSRATSGWARVAAGFLLRGSGGDWLGSEALKAIVGRGRRPRCGVGIRCSLPWIVVSSTNCLHCCCVVVGCWLSVVVVEGSNKDETALNNWD